jgi:hypothetical protein
MGFTTDFTTLLIALGLLYVPRQWLRWGKQVIKSERKSRGGDRDDADLTRNREMGDPAVVFGTEFTKIRNYVDLLRGMAGSAVIVGTPYTTSCFALVAEAPPNAGKIVLGLKCGILLGAMLVQLIRIDRKITLFAPIFFLSGVSVGLCGAPAAGFAFALIWTINLSLPNPTVFLGVHAVLLVLFSVLFNEPNNVVLTAAGFLCLFVPVLISMMSQRPLLLFNRRT